MRHTGNKIYNKITQQEFEKLVDEFAKAFEYPSSNYLIYGTSQGKYQRENNLTENF